MKKGIKFINLALLSFGFILAIVVIKYKPMYEVKVSGEQIGYVSSKQALNKEIETNVTNYKGKNIEKVELKNEPEYEFKLVDKSQEENEESIIIALQKDLEITYKYYEIASNNKKIETVSSLKDAKKVVKDIKKKSDNEVKLKINEKTTTEIENIETSSVKQAEKNIIEKLDIDTTPAIANIEGIKIANLPVTGLISSRYGAISSIRSSAHTGLDIAAPTGTNIKVVADGTIVSAAYTGSYGNLVKVNHGNGVETWYAHTSKMLVSVGQKVKAGDVIALVGSTGNSTGSHLHLEIRINGEHVNPQNYLYN